MTWMSRERAVSIHTHCNAYTKIRQRDINKERGRVIDSSLLCVCVCLRQSKRAYLWHRSQRSTCCPRRGASASGVSGTCPGSVWPVPSRAATFSRPFLFIILLGILAERFNVGLYAQRVYILREECATERGGTRQVSDAHRRPHALPTTATATLSRRLSFRTASYV